MNRKSIIPCILAAVVILSPAVGHADWLITYPSGLRSSGYSVERTADGGFIIGGCVVDSTSFTGDVRLLKTDGLGNKQWEKSFGRPDGAEYGYSAQQATDGGYIIAGSAHLSSTPLEEGYLDVWLIKTDASGNIEWDERYDNGDNDEQGYSVQQTSDGGFIVAGSSGYIDILLLKTDELGNQQWLKTYDYSGEESGYSVRETSDGGYIVAGSIEIPGSNGEALLLKTDSAGNEQWHKTFGGSWDVGARSVRQTSDEGYILTGHIDTAFGTDQDLWLIKTDSLGNKQWDKAFGGSQLDFGYSVQQDTDGGYAISGTTAGSSTGLDIWFIKTDASGNKLWDVTHGNNGVDEGFGMDLTEDGGYIIVGNSSSWKGQNGQTCLVKVEKTTTELSAITLQSPANSARVSSPPTFTWLADGGADNAFAVDISFSSRMRNYWSTYNDLSLEITGNNWTPSQELWNQIRSLRTVYWRVRGVDRSVTPLKPVLSETWSLFKP